MKNNLLAVLFLLLTLLLNHCTCKHRITEKELATIESVKRSPAFTAYKASFTWKDSCLIYQQGSQSSNALRRLGLVCSNPNLTQVQKEDTAKQLGIIIKPCFWEKSATNDKLYKQLLQQYPQIAELSPPALQNLLFVN